METDIKLSKQEFQRAINGFTGTGQYHRHIIPGGQVLLLTDGCHFVREHAGQGASWLFDLILSYQFKLRKHRFQVWTLQKQQDQSWHISCSDGNYNYIIGQEIAYSDFPLETFELWVVDSVALLPSEY